MFAPPAHPRRRYGMPGFGALYRRNSDRRLFSVKKTWARDQQVRLVAQVGTERIHVFLPDLERDFTAEVA